MQMVDGLAAPAPHIRDQPVSVIGDPLGARQLGGNREEPAKHRPIRLHQVRRRPYVSPRQEQDVGWGARLDVPNRDDEVVIVESGRGDGARRDPAEQAICGAHQSTGLELIRKPIVPTRPAITYDT